MYYLDSSGLTLGQSLKSRLICTHLASIFLVLPSILQTTLPYIMCVQFIYDAEETQTNTERTCKLQTERPPGIFMLRGDSTTD